jgi:hypothetical protein
MYIYLLAVDINKNKFIIVLVLDLVSQVHDIVLMNVYLDLENPRGAGFWDEGVI